MVPCRNPDDCHQSPCCQCASATSLVHPGSEGKVGLLLLPQMTMLSKVPDNARGDGFSCDVDSQLPLTDLMLLVVCHQRMLRYLNIWWLATSAPQMKNKERSGCIPPPICNSALITVLRCMFSGKLFNNDYLCKAFSARNLARRYQNKYKYVANRCVWFYLL